MLSEREKEELMTGCLYRSSGVICRGETDCKTCGWNPVVEKERIRKFRERMARRDVDGVDGVRLS